MRAHGFGERVVVLEADIYDFFHHCGALAAGVRAPSQTAVLIRWNVNFTAECVRSDVALKIFSWAKSRTSPAY